MQMMEASGNVKMNAMGGGGQADIDSKHISGILDANDLGPFIASGAVLPTEQDVLVFNNSQTRC